MRQWLNKMGSYRLLKSIWTSPKKNRGRASLAKIWWFITKGSYLLKNYEGGRSTCKKQWAVARESKDFWKLWELQYRKDDCKLFFYIILLHLLNSLIVWTGRLISLNTLFWPCRFWSRLWTFRKQFSLIEPLILVDRFTLRVTSLLL